MRLSYKFAFAYLVSTALFFLRHFLYLGWDFSVYVLNAQYWFAQGSYFEISRAPLVSLLLGVLSLFGWKLAEYLYIALVSLLFLYSSLKLAESLKMDSFYFYLLSLNCFVLLYGLAEGSELLALALLGLFLAFLLKNKWHAGFFLGLACLTRYPLVVFFPLLLFHKKLRNFFSSALAFVLLFLPWFFYNKITYGNIFYSLADSYALNILYRDYVPHVISYQHILFAANILLPLVLIGLVLFFFQWDFSRRKIIMLSSILLILYSIYTIKADVIRYYIPLTIPFVFFSVSSLQFFSKKWIPWIIGIFIFSTLLITLIFFSFSEGKDLAYTQVLPQLREIDGCALKSNIWVDLNYHGRTTEAFPREEMLAHAIDDGYFVLFFYDAREPTYIFNQSFLHQFPVRYEDTRFILLGNGCIPLQTADSSYLERLNTDLLSVYNYTVSEDPCAILFHGQKFCYMINSIFTVS